MPNPGTFLGPRGDFLKAQSELYAQAVKDGDVSDVVSDIQRRYFKRWPITLPHNEEQTQEWLDKVDDTAPDEDLVAPSTDGMTDKEASKATEDFSKLMKELKSRKDVSFVNLSLFIQLLNSITI